ncbi:uncharacterized protein LOC122132692 [Tachysurus ichikawai]
MNFVDEAEKPLAQNTTKLNQLLSVNGWDMRVNTEKKLHFSEFVLFSTLRPEVVICVRGAVGDSLHNCGGEAATSVWRTEDGRKMGGSELEERGKIWPPLLTYPLESVVV